MPENDIWEIRLATKEDAEEMLRIYAPFIKNSAVSFEIKIPSVEEYWQRIKGVLKEAPWLVCSYNSSVVGFAYAGKHRVRQAYRFSRELSAYTHPDFRRRNIATALYTSLIEILQMQGFAAALAGITEPNPTSVLFHEKMGFSKIGEYRNVGYKFEKFHTVGWYELDINEKIDGKIIALQEVHGTASWLHAINKGLKLIK